jgi:glutathione S-transferase
VTLTIYGSHKSRTMRVLWAVEELGIKYTHIPDEFDDPRLKSAAFPLLNPSGLIPTIVDEGHPVSESLAINLYLAKRYGHRAGPALYAMTLAEEARIWQWTLWAQGHLEPWVQKDLVLADLVRAIGRAGEGMIKRSLATLDGVLERHQWLIAPRFTVADLNVAAVLSPSRAATLDFADTPTFRLGWHGAIRGQRPWQSALGLQASSCWITLRWSGPNRVSSSLRAQGCRALLGR